MRAECSVFARMGELMNAADLKRLNVERFERLLMTETDPERRGMVERLLAEERAKADDAYPREQTAASGAADKG